MAVTKLFGNSIQPSCEYCSRNTTPNGEEPTCAFLQHMDENEDCTYFAYDPLLRKPKVLPPLKQYREEDFTL